MTALALPLVALPQAPGLREIRLYGPLRARFGRSHWLAVASPAEAVRALCVLLPGFREALMGHTGPGYRVLVGDGPVADVRSAETLSLGASTSRAIRLCPVIHGNKRGGIAQIVIGAALLIAAPYAAGALFATGTALGTSAALFVATTGVTLAKAMILGGVIQLLSPQRKGSGTQADKETSYNFNGPVNVSAEGGPVPLLIGRMTVGSVVVSAGISTDDITVATVLPAAPARPPEEPVEWVFNESPGGA